MRYTSPGRLRTADELRSLLTTLGVGFDFADTVAPDGALAQPIQLYGKTLSNRFCAHPMEGWDGTPTGGPTEHTLRRWRRFGRSGCALIWGGEAFAVRADGRANPNQLVLDQATVGQMAAMRSRFAPWRVAPGTAVRRIPGTRSRIHACSRSTSS